MTEYEEEFEQEEDKTLADWVDEWLTDERPERYDDDDRDWMTPVIEKAAKMHRERPHDELAEEAARRYVSSREGQASQRVNRILRAIAEAQTLPLWWDEDPAWKITYANVLHLPVKIGDRKVQFRAMTAGDWEEFIFEHKRQEDEINATREMTRNGAAILHGLIQQQHARRTEDVKVPRQ